MPTRVRTAKPGASTKVGTCVVRCSYVVVPTVVCAVMPTRVSANTSQFRGLFYLLSLFNILFSQQFLS